MIGEIARRCGFWTLDFLKKGQIFNNYKDIKKIIESGHEGEKQAYIYLDKLLNYAVNTTKYYSRYKGYKSLCDFPVVTKRDIKNDYEDFLSDRYTKDDLIEVYTSGSYGTPFTFYLTKEEKARQTAETIYFSKWSGYNIGMRYGFFTEFTKKTKARLIMQNEFHILSRVIDDEWMKSTRELLKKKKIKILIDFPTAISSIAQYCHEQGDTPDAFSVIGVITSSEPLHENKRKVIESTFGCNCLSRYATEELGVLAHECPSYKKHHINIASYKIEILKLNSDEPAKEGETGRIIVTDLFSYGMPLIRYETGDLGVLGKNCPCGLKGPIIENLQGRAAEVVYNTKGIMVLPIFIEDIMQYYTDIIQYQFIQNDQKSYTLNVVNKKGANFDIEKVTNFIMHWMGEDAIVKIEFSEDIQMLKSGKRPSVINKYKPNITSTK